MFERRAYEPRAATPATRLLLAVVLRDPVRNQHVLAAAFLLHLQHLLLKLAVRLRLPWGRGEKKSGQTTRPGQGSSITHRAGAVGAKSFANLLQGAHAVRQPIEL